MARALVAAALVCALCSPLAFTTHGVPKTDVPRAPSAVSFRGTAGASASATETQSSWVPTLLASAALGLM
eukprot:4942026-Amphidinium_carterae.1